MQVRRDCLAFFVYDDLAASFSSLGLIGLDEVAAFDIFVVAILFGEGKWGSSSYSVVYKIAYVCRAFAGEYGELLTAVTTDAFSFY